MEASLQRNERLEIGLILKDGLPVVQLENSRAELFDFVVVDSEARYLETLLACLPSTSLLDLVYSSFLHAALHLPVHVHWNVTLNVPIVFESLGTGFNKKRVRGIAFMFDPRNRPAYLEPVFYGPLCNIKGGYYYKF